MILFLTPSVYEINKLFRTVVSTEPVLGLIAQFENVIYLGCTGSGILQYNEKIPAYLLLAAYQIIKVSPYTDGTS